MSRFTDQQHEGDTSVMKIKELIDDEARFQQLNARSKAYAQAVMVQALTGFTNSTFCVCPSFDQLQAGAKFYIQFIMGTYPTAAKIKQGFQGRRQSC